MTTTDNFTDAARIIDAHRENERWVGDGVKIECVCGHVSHASGAITHHPITEDKNNHRDAERMHAAHVAQVLAAQEPTDAEVEAAARAISAEQDRRIGLKAGAWWGGAEYRRNFAREDARAALSAARVARRDEEKR